MKYASVVLRFRAALGPALGSTLGLGLMGSLLLWAALPPLAFGWLGWIAPVPWLVLIERESLLGRRPYRALWLAGFLFWLLAVHWLRLPHPATSLGWLALSAFLALWLPLFVGLSRVALHRLRWPLWLAAPVVWTGLELARAHVLTGFLMAALAHTQVKYPLLLQISDLFGAYGVSFVIMLVATLARPLQRLGARPLKRPRQLVPGLLGILFILSYGFYSLGQIASQENTIRPGPRVAIIQGNSLADWKGDANKSRLIMEEYLALSEQAVDQAKRLPDARPLDLILWPETMFRTPLMSFDAGFQLPPSAQATPEELASYGPRDLATLAKKLNTALLVGIDRIHYLVDKNKEAPSERPRYHAYNSAVLVDATGKMLDPYDKQHRVMFGEYIPLADWIPFLYDFTPLTGGIQPGKKPVSFLHHGFRFAPNICYETVMPHVIRRQVATLIDQGERPDLLVNLTNDAWYWGSSELDMHLACGVFRAIECRTPLVIVANGGISASIDSCGQIVQQSPRQTSDVLLVDVTLDPRTSFYVRTGDWFAGVCLLCCVAFACFPLVCSAPPG